MNLLRRISSIFLIVAVVLGSLLALLNKQNIRDWWQLRDYNPPKEIVDLATATTMTEYGRKLFYVNKPALDTKETFNEHCRKLGEDSIVLGCYNGSNIYIYNVTDQRLRGVMEVTSAHEMLHAAYDRLSAGEKEEINRLLNEKAASVSSERVKKLIDSYRQRDTGTIDNELHSILGTEVRELSPELEQHYRKYFTNRSEVVRLSEQYEKIFTDLERQIEQLDAKLAALKISIENDERRISDMKNEIDASRARLDAMIDNGQVSEYNQSIPEYNSLVDSYNNAIARLRTTIKQYNEYVNSRNSIAIVQHQLVETLDSSAVPSIQ